MDARAFFDLGRGDRPARWRLPVVPGLSTGGGFLFGGCALGAAIEALETETGRPLIWATAQYLDYARPPSVVDIDVTVVKGGTHTTQARATCAVDGREIITVNAALGSRPLEVAGQWVEPPRVPPPSECPGRPLPAGFGETIMSRLDSRLADARPFDELDGTPGTGRSALWVRVPEMLDMSAATLAVLGDYVPFGIGQTLGLRAGGNSLDNTLRVVHLVPTEWVLVDVTLHGIGNGYGHGHVNLWSEHRTLMAIGSQSVIVRFWKDEDRRPASADVAAGAGDEPDDHEQPDQEERPA